MAICGRCGKEFPTCYMDAVSYCPNCDTGFLNDSPNQLNTVVSEPKTKSTIKEEQPQKVGKMKKHRFGK